MANTVKQFMQENTAEQIYVNSGARLLFVWIESRKHKGVIKGSFVDKECEQTGKQACKHKQKLNRSLGLNTRACSKTCN